MFFLLACGIDGPRAEPNAPPPPPGRFEAPADGARHLEGTLSDPTAATRSFSFVSGGKRYVAVLTPSANVLVDGRVAGLESVPPGSVVAIDAVIHDDVLMVQRMKLGADPERAPGPVVSPAEGTVPAGAAPGAPPATDATGDAAPPVETPPPSP